MSAAAFYLAYADPADLDGIADHAGLFIDSTNNNMPSWIDHLGAVHTLKGPQGNQGFQGAQGFQGVAGAQGAQGTQGVQGSQGSQGNQGSQGTQGTQGVQGTQGNQGIGIVVDTILTGSPTITVNLSGYTQYQLLTLDLLLEENVSLNFINGLDGQVIHLRARQDAIGSRVLTMGANVRFSADLPSLTLSTDPDVLDYVTFKWSDADDTADLLSFNRGFG